MSNYSVTCLCAEKHCCECEHPVGEHDKEYYLFPGSDRWNDAAEAYFRSKWMLSSDGIRFLDEWKYGRADELCVHGMRKHACTVEDKDYKCIVCH